MRGFVGEMKSECGGEGRIIIIIIIIIIFIYPNPGHTCFQMASYYTIM